MAQGPGQVGDVIAPGDPDKNGAGKAGSQPGEHALEVELSLEELAEILGEELELPRIEPKGKQRLITQKDRYVASAAPAPSRCAISSAPFARPCGAKS